MPDIQNINIETIQTCGTECVGDTDVLAAVAIVNIEIVKHNRTKEIIRQILGATSGLVYFMMGFVALMTMFYGLMCPYCCCFVSHIYIHTLTFIILIPLGILAHNPLTSILKRKSEKQTEHWRILAEATICAIVFFLILVYCLPYNAPPVYGTEVYDDSESSYYYYYQNPNSNLRVGNRTVNRPTRNPFFGIAHNDEMFKHDFEDLSDDSSIVEGRKLLEIRHVILEPARTYRWNTTHAKYGVAAVILTCISTGSGVIARDSAHPTWSGRLIAIHILLGNITTMLGLMCFLNGIDRSVHRWFFHPQMRNAMEMFVFLIGVLVLFRPTVNLFISAHTEKLIKAILNIRNKYF